MALRKLRFLNEATSLHDFKGVGYRLEKLGDDRVSQLGIRINDQWRICFVWENGEAHNVQIADYH